MSKRGQENKKACHFHMSKLEVFETYLCDGTNILLQSNFPSYHELIAKLYPYGINNPEEYIPEYYKKSSDNSALMRKIIFSHIWNYIIGLDEVGYFTDEKNFKSENYRLIVPNCISLN